MKVILLKDVARVGKRFEVCDVPHGHALNFLIPQKLAEPATSENMKRIDAQKGRNADIQADTDTAFSELLTKLDGASVEMPVEANEKGHLFQGIKAVDIAQFITEKCGLLSDNQILLDTPIKETGEHTIKLVSGEMKGVLTLTIVGTKT